ncbi:hypothetical protein [Pseudomonas putida]|uniref:hypothetical protein n=1 Tax=Pseudomonas putida TaxID=303 RepID=UPI0013AF0F1A|nr:hypothetical protein [Pseudomonas putida]
MSSQEKQNLLGKFKNELLNVSSYLKGSEKGKLSESYKLFIEYSFQMICYAWIDKNMDRRLDNGAWFYVCQDSKRAYEVFQENHALGDALISYFDLVAAHEPFTDLLTMVHEDLLLSGKGGDGIGQFFTPSDLSNLLSELAFVSGCFTGANQSDDCSGAGSLTLGLLKRRFKADPESLKSLTVEMTDIDELACKAAFIQVAASILSHDIAMKRVLVFKSNVLTEYGENRRLLVELQSPCIEVGSSKKAGLFKAFDKVCELCN